MWRQKIKTEEEEKSVDFRSEDQTENKMKIRIEAVYSLNHQLHTSGVQVMLFKEVFPEEQKPDVDQLDQGRFHIKVEEEELWSSLGAEQLNVKQETDATSFTFTAVPLKQEDDEEKPLFSQLHQHQAEVRDLPTRSSAQDSDSSDPDENDEEVNIDVCAIDEDEDDVRLEFKKGGETVETCTVLKENVNHTQKELDDKNDGAEMSDEDEDETSEDETISSVIVRTYIKGEKRRWDKKHYCVYCKKPRAKMARHLRGKHSDEKEVAEAISLPSRSKKRKDILEKLRRKGNYYHNFSVLEKGQGEIITHRQPPLNAKAEEYLPCNFCYGFFIRTRLWRHERVCHENTSKTKSKKRQRVQTSALSLLPQLGEPSKRCLDIINRMVLDEVSTEVRNDPLICKFGNRLMDRPERVKSKDQHVSKKMRELGRFVLAAKSIDGEISTIQDVLLPPKFALAVAAAEKTSGCNSSKYRYNTPPLALKLGHSLKILCDILIGQHVEDKDEAAAGRVRNFLSLLSADWELYVTRHARRNVEEDKWNKKEMVPLTEDVLKLQNVLKVTEEKAKCQLKDGPNPKAYRMLSESLLSQILLFNRRRQGEVAKMLLLTYTNRESQEPNEDIKQSLSKLEQDLSHEFTRLVIRGKKGRKTPVLLTKKMTESLDFLMDKRCEENDILATNKFVFARPNSTSNLQGLYCLRKYALESGAKRPETLTSTQLRKQISTLSQLMNLRDNELDQLAKFMGHDIRVHREYHRLTENTLQLAKISKLLMAAELGSDVYKGKSLDEIDLGIEVALSSQTQPVSGAAPDNHQRRQSTNRRPSASSDVHRRYGKRSKGTDPKLQSKNNRRAWSLKEKAAVRRQLGQFFTLERLPGKDSCVKARKAETVLKSRSWTDIKHHVRNTITTQQKRKRR